jgi:hypothetical protein
MASMLDTSQTRHMLKEKALSQLDQTHMLRARSAELLDQRLMQKDMTLLHLEEGLESMACTLSLKASSLLPLESA